MSLSLLSSTSRVETPFIIVSIAGYTFGNYSAESRRKMQAGGYQMLASKFPNYMDSLTIEKVNGTVNTYTLTMIYAIREGDDPNLLEKVFSKAKNDRTIKISYGDLSMPSFIYKEEEAIISNITSDIDINSSVIRYTVSCVSKCLALAAGTYNFRKRVAKPSDVIKEILYNSSYGLLDVFYGMRDKEQVLAKGLILGDDKVVILDDKLNVTVLNYLSYLVASMVNISESPTSISKKFTYGLVVRDDITSGWNGPYFQIVKVTASATADSIDTYEIDIGYPNENMVMSFSLDDNQSWSILYDYSGQIQQPDYRYIIDNQGNIQSEYSPTLAKSNTLLKMTQADRTYWSNVTQYPISATLTIKGLLRPAILMTYVKVNVLFYGQRHIASGYYVVTKQTDTINASGYRTTLKLIRIRGVD